MNNLLLEAKKIKVHFPIVSGVMRRVTGFLKAVDGIDFYLKPGEVLGIVGESGSGKTTIGRAILKLLQLSDGELLFDGENIEDLKEEGLQKFRREVQLVFQDPLSSLNPRKTIGESIGESLLYHKLVKNLTEQQEKVEQSLLQVGLSTEMMHRYPHQFSGGQLQRVCIARALVMKPRLIVCDEVVSALDVSVQAQVLNLLQDLKQSLFLSYLFISHDLSVIHHMCDRVIVMYLGQVMETGSVAAVFRNPRHPYTKALLSAIPKKHPKDVDKRMLLKGEIPSAEHVPSGCPFRTRCPYAQPICAHTPPKKTIQDIITGELNHEYHCILD